MPSKTLNIDFRATDSGVTDTMNRQAAAVENLNQAYADTSATIGVFTRTATTSLTQGISGDRPFKVLRGFEDQIRSFQSQAKQISLRTEGKSLEAELLAINDAAQKRRDEIERKVNLQLRGTSDDDLRSRLVHSGSVQKRASDDLADALKLSAIKADADRKLHEDGLKSARAEADYVKQEAMATAFIEETAAAHQLELAEKRMSLIRQSTSDKSDQDADKVRFRATGDGAADRKTDGSGKGFFANPLRAVRQVDFLGTMIDRSAHQFADLNKQLNAGEISAGQFAIGLAKSVPIIGSFIDAGLAIHEAVFGNIDRNIRRENIGNAKAAASEFTEAGLDSIARRNAAESGLQREMNNFIVQQRRQSVASQLDGSQRDRYELGSGRQAELEGIEAQRKAALESNAAERLAKQKEIEAKGAAALQKIKESGAPKEVQDEYAGKIQRNELAQLKQFDDEKLKINADYDSREAQHQQTNKDLLLEADYKNYRTFLQVRRDAETEALSLRNASNEDNLRADGKAQAAELLQLKNANAAKLAEIEQQRREQYKLIGNGVTAADIDAEAQKKIDAANSETAAKERLAKYNVEQESTLKILSLQANAGDAAAAVDLKRLQLARDFKQEQEKLLALGLSTAGLDSARTNITQHEVDDDHLNSLRLQQGAGDALAALEAARLDTAKKIREQEAALLAILTDQNTVLTAEQRNKLQGDLTALEKVGQQTIDQQLRSGRERLLDQEASTGLTVQDRQNARRERESLKIEDEFKQHLAEYQELLKNPDASKAQRDQAQADLRTWGSRVEQEFDAATQNKPPDLKTGFGLRDRGLLIGTGDAQQTPQAALVRQSKEGNDIQRKILELIQQALRGGPVGPLPSIFGGP